jgi:hypothetical protein
MEAMQQFVQRLSESVAVDDDNRGQAGVAGYLGAVAGAYKKLNRPALPEDLSQARGRERIAFQDGYRDGTAVVSLLPRSHHGASSGVGGVAGCVRRVERGSFQPVAEV